MDDGKSLSLGYGKIIILTDYKLCIMYVFL